MTNTITNDFDTTNGQEQTPNNILASALDNSENVVLEINKLIADDASTCDEVIIDEIVSDSIISKTQASKEKKLKARVNAKLLLIQLSETYPNLFPKAGSGRPVALAIGLHKSLLPIIKEWGFDNLVLRSALSWYTKQLRYQRAVANAEFRINLDGTNAEVITEEQKEHARLKIAETEQWIAEHKPEKANAIAARRAEIIASRNTKKLEQNENSSDLHVHEKKREAISTKPAFKKRIKPSDKKSQPSVQVEKAVFSSNKSAESTDALKSEPVNFDDKVSHLMAKFNKH